MFTGHTVKATVPKFSWDPVQLSSDGIPLLNVDFFDGKKSDSILLTRYNPIPLEDFEKDGDVDHCIFNGYLKDDPDVYVTLTGGCPFDDNFEVKGQSFLVSWTFFSIDCDGNSI